MPRARKRVKVAPNDAEPIEPTDAAPPEEHTVNHDKAEADDNDLQADVVSNASSAPTFDDIEAVDLALFDEEEAPGYPAGITTGAGAKKKATPVHNVTSGGFNALKSFNGQIYSGMAIGGSHTWNYDQGVWKETKEEPDLWKIDFETTKRRARNAPRGSGAPVGTEYHWLIVAHQRVKKVDANTYTTHLVGSKYKLAHKNVNSNSWSIPTVKAQREREIELLDDAKRRVQGLPPVLAGERVKVEKTERGQQKLDSLFSKTSTGKAGGAGSDAKRKRDDET